jgi:DNA-binding CsgD family transcriptional regulator
MTKEDYAEFILQARLRREIIIRLRNEGKTLQAIADVMNITRQRVHTIVTNYEKQQARQLEAE